MQWSIATAREGVGSSVDIHTLPNSRYSSIYLEAFAKVGGSSDEMDDSDLSSASIHQQWIDTNSE